MKAALLTTVAVLASATVLFGEPFSHADWTAVLGRYVDGHGFVDYDGWLATGPLSIGI